MKRNNFVFIIIAFVASILFSCGGNENSKNKNQNDTTTIKTPEELSALNASISENPENAFLYNKRAKYYYSIKDLPAGLKDIEKAIALDSTNADFYLTLSSFYFSSNKTSAAKAALEKCIKLDENNTEALLKLAELYLYVTKYSESITFINKALKINPYNSKGYFMKGMCYKELKDTAKAISSMTTAVEQDKEYYHAYVQLGLLHAAKKNKLSVNYYKNAIDIQPKSTEAWYGLAKYYQDMGDWNNAIKSYDSLLNFNPAYKFAYHNKGVIYLTSLKLNEKALESFTNAIKADPKYTDAYWGRGITYQTIGDKENAFADFKACLAIDPEYEAAKRALE